jgi:hypothetical protein
MPINAALSATPATDAETGRPTTLYIPKWDELKTVDTQKGAYGTLRRENKWFRIEYSKLETSVKGWAAEKAREGEEKMRLEEEKNKAVEEAEG